MRGSGPKKSGFSGLARSLFSRLFFLGVLGVRVRCVLRRGAFSRKGVGIMGFLGGGFGSSFRLVRVVQGFFR